MVFTFINIVNSMNRRKYLIGVLIIILLFAFAVTFLAWWWFKGTERPLEYKDLITTYTACIVGGSFIVTTLNTRLSANLNQAKLDFDNIKFKNDKKIIAYNLFKEYNSDAMTSNSQIAVPFFKKADTLEGVYLVAAVEADANVSKSITILLNHLELVSICYQEDIGDKELIKELFLDIFKRHYEQFRVYIDAKQKISENFFDTFTGVFKNWELKK